MNRRFLLIVLILATVLVAIAPALGQDDVLVIWADNEREPVMAELGEEFADEFGVEVEVQVMGLGDARDQLLVAGPVGEGPDLAVMAHDTIGQLVANGAILPIELGDLADTFTASGLQLFTYEGQLWGVPMAMENVALIRNVDLVPEVPATWDEVRAINEAAAADGNFGLIVPTGNTYHNFPITAGFGGYIFGLNDDGSFNTADVGLNSEGGIASAQWLSGMYTDGLMPTDVNDDVMFDMLTSGEASMIITGPWFSQRIIETGINYSIDALPVGEGGPEFGTPFAGGQGIVISAFSENQLLAEAFLFEFFATEDAMQLVFDGGGRPPVFLGVDTSAEPNVEAFAAAGAYAIPMPAIPEMSAVWSASDAALTLISTGADPVESYNTAVEQIANAIGIMQMEETIVGLPGSHQAAVGCANDWDPACDVTFFEDQGNGIYTLTINVPAGDYEYKVALNAGWDENYGVDGVAGGDNMMLSLAEDTQVTFFFDYNTHLTTAILNSDAVIGLPGSHQAAVGCEADWTPGCGLTFFAAVGDGTYTLTLDIPAGDYEFKIALNGGWAENYGVDGTRDGDNYTLSLAADATVTFTYDSATNVLTNDAE